MLLEIQNLVKEFGGLRALDDVSFRVPENSVTAVIGPNGSGKTTCLNCINGIYRPEGGEILFQGRSLVGLPPHLISRLGIGRTFQVSRVFRKITVVENLLAPVLTSPRPTAQLKKQACGLLEGVGMLSLKDSLGEELSGGQQKLVELLRLWMSNSPLVLLDEPFAGVHPELKMLFYEQIRALRDKGRTFILISHDMKSVYALSDEIIVLDLGRIIARGQEEQIKSNPHVLQAYLGGA